MHRLPRILLHEHLDGGLRPQTVADLAERAGHDLPVAREALADWFDQGRSGSLESYLGAFAHTVAVMQTPDSLRRVASEALEDLADDGVVYAEIRFAPMLCTAGGLSGDEVLRAVIEGFESAADRVGIRWGIIVDAMRNEPDSLPVADLALRFRDRGVVGFDLAGPEAGFPPDDHLAAIEHARTGGLRITIHAGEAAGVASMERALACHGERIGHGVEIVEDCRVSDGEIVETGAVATQIREQRIPLEICPTSNLHTKGWAPEQHPIGMLHRAGFAVTINTDNRLTSRTSPSREFDLVQRHHRFGLADVAAVTHTALQAAFCDETTKQSLWAEKVSPALAASGFTPSNRPWS